MVDQIEPQDEHAFMQVLGEAGETMRDLHQQF